MVLRSIGVLSCGKLVGILYAIMGLVGGIMFGLFMLLGMLMDAGKAGNAGPIVAVVIAAGIAVFTPLFYGVMGFIGGVLSAAVYNLAASYLGGLEMEFEPITTLERSVNGT